VINQAIRDFDYKLKLEVKLILYSKTV